MQEYGGRTKGLPAPPSVVWDSLTAIRTHREPGLG